MSGTDETCGAKIWDPLNELTHACNSRAGHAGTHMEIDHAGIAPSYAWGARAEVVRVRVTWSETVTMEATRELDTAPMRRLGYDPADPASIRKYLDDAYDFTGDDFMEWHSDFSDVAKRTDTDAATIETVEIRP